MQPVKKDMSKFGSDMHVFFFNPCTVQKQPLKVLFKKKCSYKCRKIHNKTPVPESPGLRPATLLKIDSEVFKTVKLLLASL